MLLTDIGLLMQLVHFTWGHCQNPDIFSDEWKCLSICTCRLFRFYQNM